MIWTFALFSKQ